MKSMEERKIRFMDTTLRDGEQTPGVNLNVQDKLKIASALDEMHIDVIEAGFAGASDGRLLPAFRHCEGVQVFHGVLAQQSGCH